MTDRQLLAPAFPDDTGAADADLATVLAGHAAGRTGAADVLLRLQHTRVLVPVVAVLGEVEVDDRGLAHDKSSDMAAVLMQGADGRRALLAFTGTEALTAWNPQARPVPVTVATAALAAVQEGAAALVLDVAGPARFVVETDDLRALAAGWTLALVDGAPAWIAPAGGSTADGVADATEAEAEGQP